MYLESHQKRYMNTIVSMYSICSMYTMITLLYRPYVWVCSCECVPARMCVCMCTFSLPLLSASTLNESELQYSVGGAGIEYPAGGSSTHAKRFMRARISVTLDWWNTFSNTLRSDDDLKWPLWGSTSQTGCKSVALRARRKTKGNSSVCTLHTTARTYARKHSVLSHPARRSTAWPIISRLQTWLPRDEMS